MKSLRCVFLSVFICLSFFVANKNKRLFLIGNEKGANVVQRPRQVSPILTWVSQQLVTLHTCIHVQSMWAERLSAMAFSLCQIKKQFNWKHASDDEVDISLACLPFHLQSLLIQASSCQASFQMSCLEESAACLQ
ncbi:hypothetical protein CHARACLAT_028020 [Characodon lateralis]|uniref:Secreted protein n=1 Tax=Characodon lateralis TaxID=208331 RepID=A0ABU7E5P0_9TELE|nr:hypothetical protein [Characodon lateralis]